MATVVRRTFRSSPYREAHETWEAISLLLTKGKNDSAAKELKAVAGIASSVIADYAPQDQPIIVTCNGPRTRIYCTYNEDALGGEEGEESALGFDPLEGDWEISLPCLKDDLTWVQNALKQISTRITARDLDEGIQENAGEAAAKTAELTVNLDGFLGK